MKTIDQCDGCGYLEPCSSDGCGGRYCDDCKYADCDPDRKVKDRD